MRTVTNAPDECDPRDICWGVPFGTMGLPFPFKWAVEILSPLPPPDGLPRYFYVQSSFLTDPLSFLDYVREFSIVGTQQIFRVQFFQPPPMVDPGVPIPDVVCRFSYGVTERSWLSVRDLPNQVIPRADVYQPTFALDPPIVPPPPLGDYVSQVRVGGLKFNGTDADAEYRLTNW